jgi:glycosyltransferase involved in cell wall biosynthesis
LQKRFDLAVEIARQMPDCDFWCWGAAMLDLPPNLADLPPNITMMGIFKHLSDLPLAEAEGWLFTSAWEGMPTTIIELGVMGMPIIASAVGGIPELIDETTGWLVEPFDSVSGFVASLREMIENPQERIKRGRELQAQVRERYTMNSYKKALARVIRPESS